MSLNRLMIVSLAFAFTSTTFADDAQKETKPAGAAAPQAEFKLPAGWTAEDMQACMVAGTPGKMHEFLSKSAGTWAGKCTMWMGPDTEPLKCESTATVTPIMEGRYVKLDQTGEMPAGMGTYVGSATYGFDNVSQKFVCAAIDNHSTGIITGTGELSPDGKTLTWNFTFNCPVTKKPAVMREVETITGPNTKTLEMFAPDPKSGKVYKMMSIELTKK